MHEIHRKDKICASAPLKVGITGKDGLVPAPEVAEAMGKKDWGVDMPAWVTAWIEAESQRPWPSNKL